MRRGEITVTERRLLGAALDTAVQAITAADRRAGRAADHPGRAHRARRPAPPALREIAAATDSQDLPARRPGAGQHPRVAVRGRDPRAVRPPSTVTADLDSPALSLDISALDDDDDDVVAAAMLCSWAWSAALIDATAAVGRRRNIVQVQDELWRALRVAPGLVERSDRITRLGRHRGVVSIQVTHSLDDLDALPTEADRAKARGMAARNAILLLGGMADAELDGLRRIVPLTDAARPRWSPPGPPHRPGTPAARTPAAAST